MRNIRHDSNNTTVEPPEGWNQRHPNIPLKPMMATGGYIQGTKTSVLTTWWEPSPEELTVLLQGGKIQLACIGGMPPVRIEVVSSIGAEPVMHPIALALQ